ncbi:GntR family transcriptional regulator [Amycolatopsis sp. SID8362]|uniref:GntR family transcriptional regulator n=1 Tax=Amycolatopsis sp. SID8362 TaxID=2690346 RepID=UPI00136D0036|nr:GntR family transcriptional regulator [Amycolatopsis sp. SID8362]NBH08870.1 UTRA domain-containing protein [Amycolatopsis sp. SID8362]NED45562.1 GntR family transcriptional regulator [Amycolatopsis sp. SID8362]
MPTTSRRTRSDAARQLADLLRRQVLADETLPCEEDLTVEFSATRNTVREALALLRDDGLIARQPGVGTVVVGHKYPHGLNRLAGLAEVLREHGEVTNDVRAADLVPAPAVVAHRLGVPERSEVVYLERLRRLDGVPLSLDLTYLLPEIGKPLLAHDLAGRDVFALIEETSGQRLGYADIDVEALNADAETAAVLDVQPGAALLRWERLTHFADGRPVDLEYIRLRGDRLTMRARLDRS